MQCEQVRVVIARSPFAIRVEDPGTGRVLLRTSERLRQVAGFPMAPAVMARDGKITLNLEIAPGEEILGFGEQFGPLVKNGQELTLRVEDALGTGTGLAYKPVPVWHSTAGYTGFVNTGAVVTADVGHHRPSVLSLTANDDAIDLYVIAGGDPKERLRAYTALTGRAYVPPLWAFGYWMGRCRYHSNTEMLDIATTMRQHEVPCDVLHLDPDWLIVDRLNCDFYWNTDRFGDRRQFIVDLAERGIRLSLWELPYLDPVSPRYTEALELGYLAVGADGKPVGIQNTPTPDGRVRGLLDFFNPDALAWWQDLHTDFLEDGVAVFKTDFGEALPDDVLPADGLPPQHAHNLFTLRYNGAVSDKVRQATGDQSLVWGRSGWAGSQRYPGQWGGDAESTVVGMQSTLRGGLSYAMCAPGFWSHDIGGFFGTELTPALYVRWTQLGALSPLMRAHGLRPREPWAFGDQALDICREWIRLRYSLLPYLWQVAHEAARARVATTTAAGAGIPRRSGRRSHRRAVPARPGPAGGPGVRRPRRARPAPVLRSGRHLDRPAYRRDVHRARVPHRPGAPWTTCRSSSATAPSSPASTSPPTSATPTTHSRCHGPCTATGRSTSGHTIDRVRPIADSGHLTGLSVTSTGTQQFSPESVPHG